MTSAQQVLLAALLLMATSALQAQPQTLSGAHYAEPVNRYGHFALGKPHEYAKLIATTSTGKTHTLTLSEDEVFEDLAPRLVQLEKGAAAQLLTIVSRRGVGAQLVLIGLDAGTLTVRARSPSIGTPMRWLNPIGVADLDGDGRAEIAAVITPHIGGTLKIYQLRGDALVEIAAAFGFSNHVYGSPALALAIPIAMAGHMRLLVPDQSRRTLKMMALENTRLVELGRCALPAPVIGAISSQPGDQVLVELATGPHRILLHTCLDK